MKGLAAAGIVLGVGLWATTDRLTADDPASPGQRADRIDRVPVPTLGGGQLWADEHLFHQWRIQRNVSTGSYRLLDENSFRYASGAFEHCRNVLEQIKRQRELPPMHGKAVLVLHGILANRSLTSRLAKYLQRHGPYTVFNVEYASTRGNIGDHARMLARIIENLEGVEEIHFVAHSMGNIVIRRYLADQTDEAAGRRPDPRIKRFVMLAPPNHGSLAATLLCDNDVFETVLGKPGKQLGREWAWLEAELATPKCQFGIVAGGLGNDQGFNPLLPGDDDGTVTVASTRLAGARDFVVVPIPHSLLANHTRVFRYTLRFLEHGYFNSAEQRRPVANE